MGFSNYTNSLGEHFEFIISHWFFLAQSFCDYSLTRYHGGNVTTAAEFQPYEHTKTNVLNASEFTHT